MHEQFTPQQQAEISKIEKKIIETNWINTPQNKPSAHYEGHNWGWGHTRPAVPHYDHLWLWDEIFAGEIHRALGNPEKADAGIRSLFTGMDQRTGFIPNMNYQTGHNWRDIEAFTFNRPDIGSSYTQPPIIAWGAWETYEAYKKQGKQKEGTQFLKDIYGSVSNDGASGLVGFYSYFSNFRENGNESKLVGNIHPHETGRDSDPSLRPDLPFLPGKGRIVGLANGLLDYGTILLLNAKQGMADAYPEKGRPTIRDIVSFKKRQERKEKRKDRRYDWNPENARKNFWVNDVMFNALYVDNLRYMAKIGQELGQPTEEYETRANEVEQEMLDKMWNEQDGIFYNLDKNGKQIKEASITCPFPIVLDNIPENQLKPLVEKMGDPQWFDREFPFSTVPAKSRYYYPHYTEPRLWKRGEVWINTNKLLINGLMKQVQRDDISSEIKDQILPVLKKAVTQTKQLVGNDLLTTGTSHEFYDPENGKGYRIKGFTWSLGGLHFNEAEALIEKLEEQKEA